jgi:catechol 2,3-dioxygenase-like lactoylglutathione lyase family enzyme
MASNLPVSLAFYERWFDARIVADFTYAGARNVFVAIGTGRLHFYDQAPSGTARNAVNHLGFVIDDLDALHERLVAEGVPLKKGIQRFDDGNYLMLEAPDGVLLELFQPNPSRISPQMALWFELEPRGN